MPKNAIQHIEWMTRDPARLRGFFGKVFDWTFREAMPNYTLIEGVGGIFHVTDPQTPLAIAPYVNVSDLGTIEARITAAGGQIHKSKQEVPGMGWFTIFADPDGTVGGLWQALNPPKPVPAKRARPAAAKKAAKKAVKKAAKKVAAKKSAKPARAAAKKKVAKKRARR